MLNGNSRNADKFVVRLPDGMRERIAAVSSGNHRSMNSEIITRLEESLIGDDAKSAAIDDAKLSKEEKAIVHAARQLAPAKRKALLALLADGK